MRKNTHWIHTVLPLSLIIILLVCGYVTMFPKTSKEYPKGRPVIVGKSQSLNGKATYTYEGYGRREEFEDNFDKFSVGDTLPLNRGSFTDTTKVEPVEIIDTPVSDSTQ